MDSYFDYYESQQEWLYELFEDAEGYEEPDEDEEEDPSLDARARNENLS